MNLKFGPGFHTFLNEHEALPGHSAIYVRTRFEQFAGGKGLEIYALLDTGADWTVLPWELANELDLPYGAGYGEPFVYDTRIGKIEGELLRCTVTIPSDDDRSAVTLDSTAFVSPYWNSIAIIGYHGFLESLRFGVDPGLFLFFFCPSSQDAA
jgi:hypothetical protein